MPDHDASPAAHILAVDDDPLIRDLVSTYLAGFDIRVTAVPGPAEMTSILETQKIDLVLLDLKLRGSDGMTIARELRAASSLPIIILTGRMDEADRIMGLELGADDYLTKPFSPRELLARIRALLRRTQMHSNLASKVSHIRAYRFEGWELSLRLRRLLTPSGEAVPLATGEFNLLIAFLASPQRALSREELLELSRLHNGEVYDRAIDVQVARLRRKIQPVPGSNPLIVTERNAGYRFEAEVEVVRD
ncbi:MAG: response regulator transcription factor [Polaromonas sp.]|nr:response regulator transcription factor [Polaromonas sp.]